MPFLSYWAKLIFICAILYCIPLAVGEALTQIYPVYSTGYDYHGVMQPTGGLTDFNRLINNYSLRSFLGSFDSWGFTTKLVLFIISISFCTWFFYLIQQLCDKLGEKHNKLYENVSTSLKPIKLQFTILLSLTLCILAARLMGYVLWLVQSVIMGEQLASRGVDIIIGSKLFTTPVFFETHNYFSFVLAGLATLAAYFIWLSGMKVAPSQEQINAQKALRAAEEQANGIVDSSDVSTTQSKNGGLLRTSTVMLVLSTLIYLVFEIGFNLHLLDIIAFDRLHFYTKIDEVGRLLSAVGCSLLFIRAFRSKLVQEQASSLITLVKSIPLIFGIMAGVYFGQEMMINTIAKVLPTETKERVLHSYGLVKNEQMKTLRVPELDYQSWGSVGSSPLNVIETDERDTVQAAMLPLMAIVGIADFNEYLPTLTTEQFRNITSEVMRGEIKTNYSQYTNTNFARSIRESNPEDTGHNPAFSLGLVEYLYNQSGAINSAINSYPSDSAIQRAQAKLWRTFSDELNKGEAKFKREANLLHNRGHSPRLTALASSRARKNGINLPRDWNHHDRAGAKKAIYRDVKKNMINGSKDAIIAVGYEDYLPLIINNRNSRRLATTIPEIQKKILEDTKGWYFANAKHKDDYHTHWNTFKKEVEATTKLRADYLIKHSDKYLDDQFKGILAPTVAMFISFFMIVSNIVNMVIAIVSDLRGKFSNGKKSKGIIGQLAVISLFAAGLFALSIAVDGISFLSITMNNEHASPISGLSALVLSMIASLTYVIQVVFGDHMIDMSSYLGFISIKDFADIASGMYIQGSYKEITASEFPIRIVQMLGLAILLSFVRGIICSSDKKDEALVEQAKTESKLDESVTA